MGRHYNKVRNARTLHTAFKKVRDHALRSASAQTRHAVVEFEKDVIGSIRKLQERLRQPDFEFYPQRGIAKRKRNSSGYRPLVVAPFEDRIIQRAILDVLITDVAAVKQITSTRTSIGGIPGRDVKSAIDLVQEAIAQGAKYFLRSDIENFFTRIPKSDVKQFIASHVKDHEFLSLFARALNTELHNLAELADFKYLFPLGDDGVAQGSTLSTLAGNIVLNGFDKVLNERNVTCVRYVDDFLILGRDERCVKKAFDSAQALLRTLQMRAYSPWIERAKADHGYISNGFTFLGCDIHSDGKFIQPSARNRKKLLNDVETIFTEALKGLTDTLRTGTPWDMKLSYAQVLMKVGSIVSGWRHAFRFCKCTGTFESLNNRIDELTEEFSAKFLIFLDAAPLRIRRRSLGVQLLQTVNNQCIAGQIGRGVHYTGLSQLSSVLIRKRR